MKSTEIRSKFINFFKSKAHLNLPSSSLIPHKDPTLLFNNAGMNQFKNTFLGIETPKNPRAVTSQKCVRAGGKHNDLDNVGFTARHHTFFEMLGNFSFGDYFKEEAISYAWEFLTQELKIDKSKLYVTTFHTDLESKNIWLNKIGVSEDHHFSLGEKDNFWRMGNTGPCGPCSEIFYDFGPEMGTGPDDVVGGDGDRFIEIWNLVFMQFNETENGQTPLTNPSIDTGMGLERISMLMQGAQSNYETDLFIPLIKLASDLTQTAYNFKAPEKSENTAALRVLADHSRAISFLIADGVLPSNEGRGYVLRRILRRAVRFNKKLCSTPILTKLCAEVIKEMSSIYPELLDRKSIILDNVKDEELKFLETLEKGELLLEKEVSNLKGKILSGAIAFKLYDTFGFPVDLTEIILKEKGYSLDIKGFNETLKKAKEQAKSNRKNMEVSFHLPESLKDSLKSLPETKFTGREQTSDRGLILEIHTSTEKIKDSLKKGLFYLITDLTPFYAESGGQIGDSGRITTKNGKAKVLDVKKLDHLYVHLCEHESGSLSPDETIELSINTSRRKDIERNHSATHLLHAALVKFCGESIQQAGSLVDHQKLRFDFNHKGPVSKNTLLEIENFVISEIQKAEPVQTKIMNVEDAKKSGAKALFGEKYENEVRVLNIGEHSKELCGGTHVQNTSDITIFKITGETGVSSGIRRIEAVTGSTAINYLKSQASSFEDVTQYFKLNSNVNSQEVINQINKLSDEVKALKKKLKQQSHSIDLETEMIHSKYGDLELCVAHQEKMSRNELRDAADRARDKMKNLGICVFIGEPSEKGHPILVSKTKNLKDFNSGLFLKKIADKFGGKGGGRPDFAQGNIENYNDSFQNFCKEQLSN